VNKIAKAAGIGFVAFWLDFNWAASDVLLKPHNLLIQRVLGRAASVSAITGFVAFLLVLLVLAGWDWKVSRPLMHRILTFSRRLSARMFSPSRDDWWFFP
jgi:hypothetical protein